MTYQELQNPRDGLFETMILHKNTITKWLNHKYQMIKS